MIAGMPTKRQLEAFHLRCEGLTFEEIATRMGIAWPTANQLARAAAIKLIRNKPRPSMVNNAALARKHFPMIAKRWPLKETEST